MIERYDSALDNPLVDSALTWLPLLGFPLGLWLASFTSIEWLWVPIVVGAEFSVYIAFWTLCLYLDARDKRRAAQRGKE